MSIDNFDARFEDGSVQVGLFEGLENRDTVSISVEHAKALVESLNSAIVEAITAQENGAVELLRAIKTYDELLNERERVPDGDDYNEVVGFALAALKELEGES